ncbi:MAG: ATP-binding cassette domain-containing protein [Terriglobia bacterium]
MNNRSPFISLHSVCKSFGSLAAVQDVSFAVAPGEIFGLLGPNGAGKTTLLRLVMDLIRPDKGSIEVFGGRLEEAGKNRIGYLPEERGLFARQRVGRTLRYLAQLKGVPESQARTNVLNWLVRLEMGDVLDRKLQELSKGNQQKVQFIATVASDPDVLILDEPFSGLDPVNTRMLLEIIRELAAAGKVIILSTHQMNLVESLCRRVFMIDAGRQILYGELEEIQKSHSDHSFLVRSEADFRQCPFILTAVPEGRGTRVTLKPEATGRDLLAWLVETGNEVLAFEKRITPLEEIFIQLVKQS